ncbi:autotransporter-associated beta strand repeat-containing protein [Camelimonas abortus]|uniref:Autotransporter-associated beta strand repeat-containing protein n=1 Tax=Camelimonas abortus TaxID=1017184 RepID=A0ABV7LAT0_9HYPH
MSDKTMLSGVSVDPAGPGQATGRAGPRRTHGGARPVVALLPACTLAAAVAAAPAPAAAAWTPWRQTRVEDPADFPRRLNEIVTGGKGGAALRYTGPFDDIHIADSVIAAPGTNASLLIKLKQGRLFLDQSTLVLGKNATFHLGSARKHDGAELSVGGHDVQGVLTLDGGALGVRRSENHANTLWIGRGAGSQGALNILGGALTLGNGDDPAGGTARLAAGHDGGQADVVMDGGVIRLPAQGGSVILGDGGSAVLTMKNGALIDGAAGAAHVLLGGRNGGRAVANIDSSAVTIAGPAAGPNRGAFLIGHAGGSGEVSQNGDRSRVDVSGLDAIRIGDGPGATGVYNLNGGSLIIGRPDSPDTLHVGSGADPAGGPTTARLNVNGGVAQVYGDLAVGAGASGRLADAAVTINGGAVRVGGVVRFGQGAGRLDLNGGQLELAGGDAIAGDGALTLAGGAIRACGPLSVAHPAVVTGSGGVINSNGHPVTWSGALSGDGPLVKTGDGTLTLAGTNDHAGGIAVRGGVVELARADAAGAGPVSIDGGLLVTPAAGTRLGPLVLTIRNGTIDLAGADQTLAAGGYGPGGVSFVNSGAHPVTLTLESAVTWAGRTVIGAGIRIGTTAPGQLSERSTLELDKRSQLTVIHDQTAGGLEGDGTVTLARGAVLTVGANHARAMFDGAIDGEGALRKTGDGVLELAAPARHVGGVEVAGGVVAVAHPEATGPGPVTLDGGVLRLAVAGARPGRIIAARGGAIDLAGQDLTLSAGGEGDAPGGEVSFINSAGAPATLTLDSAIVWRADTRVGPGVTLATTAPGQLPEQATLSLHAEGRLVASDDQVIGGLAGAGAARLDGGAMLAVGANGADTTYAGVISGDGGLLKTGAGRLTLAAPQAYGGPTVIGSGVLALADGGALAESSRLLVDGGALDLGGRTQKSAEVELRGGRISNGVLEAGALALAGGVIEARLAGAGALVKTGPDTALLAGDNSAFTGAVNVTAGALEGPVAAFGAGGRLAVAAGAGVVFREADRAVWTGEIAGAGRLAVTGGGEVEIAGDSGAFSGVAEVTGATLRVNGALPQALVEVRPDGRVAGEGVVGALAVAGVAAPGNSPGVLRVNGDVRFMRGSVFEVEVTPDGASGGIVAGGVATIEGGAVVVRAGQGN